MGDVTFGYLQQFAQVIKLKLISRFDEGRPSSKREINLSLITCANCCR